MIKSIHVGHFYEYVVSFYATYMQESEISSLGSTSTLRHNWCSWLDVRSRVGTLTPGRAFQTTLNQNKIRQTTSYDKNHTIIQFYKHVMLFYVIYLKMYGFCCTVILVSYGKIR